MATTQTTHAANTPKSLIQSGFTGYYLNEQVLSMPENFSRYYYNIGSGFCQVLLSKIVTKLNIDGLLRNVTN